MVPCMSPEDEATRIARLEERLRAHEAMHGTRVEEMLARLRQLERQRDAAVVGTIIVAAAAAGIVATLTVVAERMVAK